MTPAPRLKGYVCSLCGNESIQTPWGEEDFVCSQELGGCGATNKGPLKPVGGISIEPVGGITAQQVASIYDLTDKS